MIELLKELGASLKSKRQEKQLTVVTLANALNISPTYISMMENAKISPTPHVLRKLCDKLELDYEESLKKTIQYQRLFK